MTASISNFYIKFDINGFQLGCKPAETAGQYYVTSRNTDGDLLSKKLVTICPTYFYGRTGASCLAELLLQELFDAQPTCSTTLPETTGHSNTEQPNTPCCSV